MNIKQELKNWLNIKELDVESENILDARAILLSQWLIAHVRKKQESYPSQQDFAEQLASLIHLFLLSTSPYIGYFLFETLDSMVPEGC